MAPYDGGVGAALLQAKGRPDLALARVLGRWLARRVARDPEVLARVHTHRITWVPSPWPRRLRRGFDLAAVLAHPVAALGPRSVTATVRVRPGPRQATAGRRGRRDNLRGRVRSTAAGQGPVLVVDDVHTTGATGAAVARELLSAGFDRVDLLTVCIAYAGGPPCAMAPIPVVTRSTAFRIRDNVRPPG